MKKRPITRNNHQPRNATLNCKTFAIPGEKIAILIPGSAIKAVATGTHTPQVTKSTSIGVLQPFAVLSFSCSLALPFPCSTLTSLSAGANIPSETRNMDPYIDATVLAMSSRRKKRPAHSPRDPPSSSFPMESLDRMMGIMATLANALSASAPFPNRAKPLKQCPIINNKFSFLRFLACLSLSFDGCTPPRPIPSSSSSGGARSSWNCRSMTDLISTRSSSNLPTRHLTVSLSSRRMRGDNFMRKRDFSMMTPPSPEAELEAVAGPPKSEGRELLALSSEVEEAAVRAETWAEEVCNSWRR
mmetsp:Transcript_8480/g.17530  ORF Transcript_8480/g.17530 Transcript_8480/m.17530 type:complete len:301 (+) Transcript_8480:4280-5182(+)